MRFHVEAWGSDELPDISGDYDELPNLSGYAYVSCAALEVITYSQIMASLRETDGGSLLFVK